MHILTQSMLVSEWILSPPESKERCRSIQLERIAEWAYNEQSCQPRPPCRYFLGHVWLG